MCVFNYINKMSVLKGFTVIDLLQTRSKSVVTIQGNFLKFNKQTAEEPRHPAYIKVLISPQKKQFAIQGYDKEEKNFTLPFCTPESEDKPFIKIPADAVTDLIYRMANWDLNETWKIPGVCLVATF